jgi:hypothetical protein
VDANVAKVEPYLQERDSGVQNENKQLLGTRE